MNVMNETSSVGVFANPSDLELAIQELKNSNFPLDQVLIATGDTESAKMGDRTRSGIFVSTALEGVSELILGLNRLEALQGRSLPPQSGSLGALMGLGIPPEQAQTYADLIAQGYYLVMVQGKAEQILQAKMILSQRTPDGLFDFA